MQAGEVQRFRQEPLVACSPLAVRVVRDIPRGSERFETEPDSHGLDRACYAPLSLFDSVTGGTADAIGAGAGIESALGGDFVAFEPFSS